MQGELDPNTLSDRTLLLLMYQEQKYTRTELADVKQKVGSWRCPNQQCKDHEERMDAQDGDIAQIGEQVMKVQDHERIIVGTVVIIVTVFGVYIADKLLGG